MPDVNAGTPRRFEAGGVITLTDGATVYTIKNTQPGTLRIAPGMTERLNYTDRGVQQTPLEGDDQLTEIDIDCKVASLDSDNLYQLASAAGSSGLVKLYDLDIQIEDYRGASAGDEISGLEVWFREPPVIQAGADFDTISLRLASAAKVPAFGSY